MNFWKKFKQMIPLKHVIFLLCIFTVTFVIHYFDSAEDIQISFGETSVNISTSPFNMNIPYDMIESVELVDMPDGGDVISGADNLVKRYGTWQNDTWGEYSVCADLDCTNCIVAHLNDGRIFVFSRKSNQTTVEIYEELQTYLAD